MKGGNRQKMKEIRKNTSNERSKLWTPTIKNKSGELYC